MIVEAEKIRLKAMAAVRARRYNQKNAEKNKARSYDWRRRNPEQWKTLKARSYQNTRGHQIAKSQAYRAANGEQIRQKARAAYETDPQPKLRAVRKWNANNPGSIATRDLRRRESRSRATPAWLTKEQRAEINQFYKEARRLTRLTGIEHHVDHVHPLVNKQLCGLHVPWNLQVLVGAENIKKGNKLPDTL